MSPRILFHPGEGSPALREEAPSGLLHSLFWSASSRGLRVLKASHGADIPLCPRPRSVGPDSTVAHAQQGVRRCFRCRWRPLPRASNTSLTTSPWPLQLSRVRSRRGRYFKPSLTGSDHFTSLLSLHQAQVCQGRGMKESERELKCVALKENREILIPRGEVEYRLLKQTNTRKNLSFVLKGF